MSEAGHGSQLQQSAEVQGCSVCLPLLCSRTLLHQLPEQLLFISACFAPRTGTTITSALLYPATCNSLHKSLAF